MGPCPAREQLQYFLDEQLDEAEATALAGHIEECALCQQALDAPVDASWGGGSRPGPRHEREVRPAPGSAFLQRLVDNPPADAATLFGRRRPMGFKARTLPGLPTGDEPEARREWPVIPGYDVVAELGRGGMGVVYQVWQAGLQRMAALKMVLAGAHAKPQDLDRFRNEAQAVARLHHPNIVQIYEVGDREGSPYLVLEFVQGNTLGRQLAGNPLPPGPAAELLETLAQAVHYAHRRGVVHRDLTPANVLLTPEGTPKITDFGLAKLVSGGDERTLTGTIMGTPSYMAPEQAEGRTQEMGPAIDVYSLGAILYELLTGRPPFKGSSPLETVMQVVSVEVVPPTRLQPRVPPDLETICLKCLQKEAHRRYASAEDLAQDLRRFREGKPIAARPVGALERALRWCQRNPLMGSLAGGVAMSLLAGTVIASYFAVQARHQAAEARRSQLSAEFAAQRLQEEKLASDRHLYAAQLALVQRAWDDAQPEQVRALLDGQRPERTGGIDQRNFEWYFWDRLCSAYNQTLRGHGGPVTGLTYSPDGKWLATSSADETVRVWELDGGADRTVLVHFGHVGPVNGVAFSRDGRRLASAGADGTVRTWDTLGHEIATLEGHVGAVHGVAFGLLGSGPEARALLASASADGTVRIWDEASGKQLHLLRGHRGPVRSVAFSPDSKRLASAGWDRVVRVWDTSGGQEVLTLPGHTGEIRSVAFSPDGKRLASASADRTVRVWDTSDGQPVLSLTRHGGFVSGVAFTPDSKRLASAADDRIVRIWDVTTGQEVLVLQGFLGPITGLAFSPHGNHLALAGWDHSVRVWDYSNGQQTLTLAGEVHSVGGVAFGADGKRLASAGVDGIVSVWDTSDGRRLLALRGHRGPVNSVAFSPEGARVASSGEDGTVRLWDAMGGQEVLVLQAQGARARGVAFSPDGKRLACGAEDKLVYVWDLATGKLALTLEGHSELVTQVAFSPDGHRLASASADTTVRVWDLGTSREVLCLREHHAEVASVLFSPDGRHLASAGADRMIFTWDANTGQRVLALEGHLGEVGGIAFSPDGQRLASAGGEGLIRVWDTASGQQVLALYSHLGPVYSVAFSPDGRRLASAGGHGLVKVWDATPRDVAPRE